MELNNNYPKSNDLVSLLGTGLLISATIFSPGAGSIAKSILKSRRKREAEIAERELLKFNPYALKRNLKRLQHQKVIETIDMEGNEVFQLTAKGKRKLFKQGELNNEPLAWQGKWFLVIYDVSKLKRSAQNAFRQSLKEFRFLQLQKSVYISPVDFTNEIDYLREKFSLKNEVIMLEASNIENQEVYKQYFGIK